MGNKMKVTNCRSCGDPIFWAKTAAGKLIPMDVEATEDGNMVLLEEALAPEPLIIPQDEPPPVVHMNSPKAKGKQLRRFVSHFATCRDRERWREDSSP